MPGNWNKLQYSSLLLTKIIWFRVSLGDATAVKPSYDMYIYMCVCIYTHTIYVHVHTHSGQKAVRNKFSCKWKHV